MKPLPLLFVLTLLHLTCAAQIQPKTTYVCAPCHNPCDQLQFQQPGICPACGMKLIPKEDLIDTEKFSFTFDNIQYSAEVGKPKEKQPAATIVIIPGHGKTDFVDGTQYYDLRQFFTRLGFATLVWDKKGCGSSQGEYEHHQSVESSAAEAIAAIEEFKNRKFPGSNRIGLWGISRAGWICPLVINKYPSIAFWISVSGTDQFDNFRYMVETNLKIEGRSDAYTSTVMKEWDHYINVLRHGGESYEQLVLSTANLFKDPFYVSLGEKIVSNAEFNSAQEYYKKSGELFDEERGIRILVPGFEAILGNIKCPVLAIFGTLDSQVDPKKTETLYRKTIGNNPTGKLEIRDLPDCNHNMMTCKTGGLYENLEKYNGAVCSGYFESIKEWLLKNKFTK